MIGIPICFASVVLLDIDDPGGGKWSKIGVQEMNTGNNNVEVRDSSWQTGRKFQ